MQFHEILSNLMRDKGITAYKMSKDTGIADSLISYWKNGKRKPTSDNLQKLATYLEVSTDYLLGDEQKEKPAISFDDELSELLKDTKNKAVYDRLIKLTPENFDLALAQLDALLKHQEKKDRK